MNGEQKDTVTNTTAASTAAVTAETGRNADQVVEKTVEARTEARTEATPAATPAPAQEPRRRQSGYAGVIWEEVPSRARQLESRLHAFLTGTIELVLTDVKESYFFDWRGETMKVSKSEGVQADCRISMRSGDLNGIISGDLNPQIGILSKKIGVIGRTDLFVYFFNLFAPRLPN